MKTHVLIFAILIFLFAASAFGSTLHKDERSTYWFLPKGECIQLWDKPPYKACRDTVFMRGVIKINVHFCK